MTPDDTESDDFFDALSGRRPNGEKSPNPGAQAMRAALLAQAQTVREAHAAQASDLSDQEAAQMAELKQRLVQQGVLPPPRNQPSKARPPQQKWWRALADTLLGGVWPRSMAMAASLVLVSAVVVRLAFVPTTDPDVERGRSDTPELISPRPDQAAELLTAKLTAAGADVLLVQTNEQEWTLRITVPRSANSAAIVKVLGEAGIKVTGPGPYRVLVRSGVPNKP